jgi:tight adherence protein B
MPLDLILIFGGGFAVILLLIGLVVTSGDQRRLVDERLNPLWEDEIKKAKRGGGDQVKDWLNAQAESTSYGGGLSRELARADLKFKAGEFILLILLSMGFFGFALYWLGGQNLVLAPVGAAVGFFLPRVYLKIMQAKRLTKFDGQLSDMLNLMVNGLRAGYSSMQAMEAVSKEMPAPISLEFRRVVQEMQLGVNMETALANLLRRIPSEDLDLVITAMNVQREVGGNLAEILATISHTIRERVRIKGEVRVLTSQVVYSGRFLTLLPFLIFGAIYVMNPGYLAAYLEEPRIIGIGALVMCAILLTIGTFIMNKIGKIEV